MESVVTTVVATARVTAAGDKFHVNAKKSVAQSVSAVAKCAVAGKSVVKRGASTVAVATVTKNANTKAASVVEASVKNMDATASGTSAALRATENSSSRKKALTGFFYLKLYLLLFCLLCNFLCKVLFFFCKSLTHFPTNETTNRNLLANNCNCFGNQLSHCF